MDIRKKDKEQFKSNQLSLYGHLREEKMQMKQNQLRITDFKRI